MSPERKPAYGVPVTTSYESVLYARVGDSWGRLPAIAVQIRPSGHQPTGAR